MRVFAVAALLVAATQAVVSQPCAQFSPAPVPLSQLPAYFPRQKTTNVAQLLDIEDIRQTLTLYAYVVDGRDFNSLSEVFASYAIANYSAPLGILNGSQAIVSTLTTALAQFAGTQHLLGSQSIRLCDKDKAISTTYQRSAHFLQNSTVLPTGLTDDSAVLYAYGQYQDSWVKRDGVWKIAYRNLVYMVRRKEPEHQVRD